MIPTCQERQKAILKWCQSGHVRTKIEKCHDVTEEDSASSNTPRVCIEAKSRHMQSSREWGDTSIVDKLEEGRVGPQAITSKVRVSIWVSACSLGIKSVNMKDESSPNLVSIEYSTDYARDRMFARQNDVYLRRIENDSKCTIGRGMLSAL